MLTPQFKVEQNEDFIILFIKLKYVKISEVDFFIEKNNFRFHLKPYFLNLFFSDNLVEGDNCPSKYNPENGVLECRIQKEVKGTVFKDIDLLNNLLENPKQKSHVTPKIQVIDEGDNTYNEIKNHKFTLQELNDLLLNGLNSKIMDLTIIKNYHYGFNNEFIDVFLNREEELFELADLNPAKLDTKERFFSKYNQETSDFCPERYAYDMVETDQISHLFSYNIETFFKVYDQANTSQANKIFYENKLNEKEFEILQSLKSKKISLLPDEIYFEIYLQVLDISFAYLYDVITNDYEHSSESGWNINKLSSVLSNFVDFKGTFWSKQDDLFIENFINTSVQHAIIGCYRRVLTYSLYRNFNLCEKILNCLIDLVEKGKLYILKIILDTKNTFAKSEPRYLLNTLYLDSFCIWIQRSNDSIWELVLQELKLIKITKFDVDLGLEQAEKEYNE